MKGLLGTELRSQWLELLQVAAEWHRAIPLIKEFLAALLRGK
jgi:hypothetical protein